MPLRFKADNVTVFVKYLARHLLPQTCVVATINRQQQWQQPTLCLLRWCRNTASAAGILESLRHLLRRGASYRSSLATSHSTVHDLLFHVTILN